VSQTKLTRRRLLLLAGGTIGASTLACSGLMALNPNQPVINFPETILGDSTMNDKILVAYASQAGSTAEVAEAIAKTLTERGAQVDVCRMKNVSDLSPYRAVVAGSAIHGSKWLPEGIEFVQRNRNSLSQKPFAAFLVGITLGMAGAEKYREGVSAQLNPVRALVRPVSEGLFAGSLDFSKLPTNFDTLMLRAVVALGILPGGDHRDWNAIRDWANTIYPLL
jgi:menaquinone-dependent protoporphyrinogen oxidase